MQVLLAWAREAWPYLFTIAYVAGAAWVTVDAVLRKRHVHSVVGWVGLAWLAPISGGDRLLPARHQPFAVMVRNTDYISRIAKISISEKLLLESSSRPIVVLEKRDMTAHKEISNLHTIGCMLPYTGLHHLLFSCLAHPFLVMTSANMPGYPMITDIDRAMAMLNRDVDFFLTHNRKIVNRCDDSVVRDGFIIRLSRGMAPKRTGIDLGERSILGVGPELNSNVTVYKDHFATTSPHVGNVRNPHGDHATLARRMTPVRTFSTSDCGAAAAKREWRASSSAVRTRTA